MKAKEFEDKFDKGESIVEHLDLSRAIRPESQQRRVNVDFPVWMIESLDREAKRPALQAVDHQGMDCRASPEGIGVDAMRRLTGKPVAEAAVVSPPCGKRNKS